MKTITDDEAPILLNVLEESCTKGFEEVIIKFNFISNALKIQKARLLLAPRRNAKRGSTNSKSYSIILDDLLGKTANEIKAI